MATGFVNAAPLRSPAPSLLVTLLGLPCTMTLVRSSWYPRPG